MESGMYYERNPNLPSLSRGNNDKLISPSGRRGNPSVINSEPSMRSYGYSESMAKPTQNQWQKQNDNNNCIVINLTRELKGEEVSLIQNVAASLDSSINISLNRNDSKQIRIVCDNGVHPCILSSMNILIKGIDEIYRNFSKPLVKLDNSSPVQVADQPKSPTDVVSGIDVPTNGEEISENPDVFERPLSLKGQRHVFLYKCRYSQLKSIIDKSGCWGLRMASLEDKWPCLVVYSAKDRESWMNAFRKIQKLERTDFLRKKVSDSLKNVDLKRLEELTQSYGQKNACISLCVQSPSSPENPSVSVCGLESYVEQLFKIFVEYHLVAEELVDSSATQLPGETPPMFNPMIPPVFPQSQPNNMYRNNDIFFPIGNHPLYTPYSPTGFTTQDMGNDIHDNYNTTFNNPHFDNYPYSHMRQDSHRQRDMGLQNRTFSLRDRFREDPFFLDNEHYFPSSPLPTIPETPSSFLPTHSIPNEQKDTKSEASKSGFVNQDELLDLAKPRLGATKFTEFFPSSAKLEKENPIVKERAVPERSVPIPPEETQSSVKSQPKINEIPSLTPWVEGHETPATHASRLRHRDDNFELFMDSNGFPDYMADVMSPGLSFNSQWRDDGW